MEWDISRAGIRAAAERRARIHRWQAPGRARVVHPAILNAAEVWGCDWTEIRDAKVWAAPGEKAVPMPTLYK